MAASWPPDPRPAECRPRSTTRRDGGRSISVIPTKDTSSIEASGALATIGVARIPGPFARLQQAWNEARAVVDGAVGNEAPLAIIGDFVLAPPDGPPSRDFQTLHFDFGLPLVPVVPTDVARFTALQIPAGMPASDAATRLVPLRQLLRGRPWPNLDDLVKRFAAYGHSHGAWDDAAGYAEGSLARIVEAALPYPGPAEREDAPGISLRQRVREPARGAGVLRRTRSASGRG